MAWVLVRSGKRDSIYKIGDTKYGLLRQVEIKEPLSRRNVRKYSHGDLITVIFRKTYKKWFQNKETGRVYQETVNEVSEAVYTLKQI
ncbi:hypothetical protein [Rossellomorea marisflavi]|uniref:hypothetical protein n=1 Tax=Rossellomorea marisflavi TaxID=189381 RepID=UPI003FA07461